MIKHIPKYYIFEVICLKISNTKRAYTIKTLSSYQYCWNYSKIHIPQKHPLAYHISQTIDLDPTFNLKHHWAVPAWRWGNGRWACYQSAWRKTGARDIWDQWTGERATGVRAWEIGRFRRGSIVCSSLPMQCRLCPGGCPLQWWIWGSLRLLRGNEG